MIRLLLFAILSAGLALPQVPGLFPWWESPLVRDLNLSQDQRNQIRNITSEYRDRLIQSRADTQKAEGDLLDVFNEEQPDARKAEAAIDKLVVARGEMTRSYALMSLQLRQVLTSQQWQQLQRRQPPGPGGRGMPGAPGMGPKPGPRPPGFEERGPGNLP